AARAARRTGRRRAARRGRRTARPPAARGRPAARARLPTADGYAGSAGRAERGAALPRPPRRRPRPGPGRRARTGHVGARRAAARPGGDTRRGPVLVGRAAEFRAAEATWRDAARGRARLLLVTGEPGIGKSRLVEELARRVTAEGHVVAHGRAYAA